MRLRALTLATTWLHGGWRRRVSWPSDLRRTWLQGVFASCTLSNDLHAGHVRKVASTSSKPRSTSPNRSPSRSCTGKACRSGERRCCAKHQPCSVCTVCCRLGAGSHVDGHVLVEVAHRAAADVDVGAAQLHDASTHRLCELNQQHSLTSSLATSSTLSLLHSPTTSFMALARERCAVFSERTRVNSPLSISLPLPFFCVLFFAILIPCLSSSAFARILTRRLSCISFIPRVFNSW